MNAEPTTNPMTDEGTPPVTQPAASSTEWAIAIPIERFSRSPGSNRQGENHSGRGDFGQDDEICVVLAEAARQRRAVVLALVDGTRLNGTPLPYRAAVSPYEPVAFEARTVRLQEESGTEPFVVRLAHVLYVRVLGTRRPSN